MEVTVRLFAMLRERAGTREVSLELPDGARVGDAIAVSAPHRAAALAACQEAIDTLKQTVPLWKKEVYEGGEEWIGQGS